MRKWIVPVFGIALVVGVQASQARQFTVWDTAEQRWITYNADAMGRGHAYKPIKRESVDYDGKYGPNTIIINTSERRLYYVYEKGKAIRYGVGVGREGFQWSGVDRISRKAEWPGWTPPPQMIAREKANGVILPAYMPGGPDNPLGARALYIGARLYRIHGSNQPWTIGHAVSSGCIRMTNEDVIDLYDQVKVGAKVVVLR